MAIFYTLAGTFARSIQTKVHYKFWRKGIVGVFMDYPFLGTPISSGTGKATNFKFCTHFNTINRNKSPLTISGKVALGVPGDSRNFSGHHIGRIAW